MLLAGLVVGLVIGYSAGTNQSRSDSPEPPVAQQPVGEVDSPEASVDAATTGSATSMEEEPEVAVQQAKPVATASRGDQRACELLVRASEREANSPSWIDMMGDASSAAKDFDLMDLVDKAYWS